MIRVKVHDAKTNLSKLLVAVEAGEEVIILRGDAPVARIVPMEARHGERRPGRWKGLAILDDSFFDPLPAAELDAWDGV